MGHFQTTLKICQNKHGHKRLVLPNENEILTIVLVGDK